MDDLARAVREILENAQAYKVDPANYSVWGFSAGVPVARHIYPGVDHGIGPGTGTAAQGWIDQAARFWLEQS